MVVSYKTKKKQHAYVSSSLSGHHGELFTQMVALNLKVLQLSHYSSVACLITDLAYSD